MKCEDVGQKIATLRKGQNKTQKKLAEELGVTNKAVSKWETGEGYPDITLLPDISYVLKISIDELLDNDPYKEQAQIEYLQSVENRKESNNKIIAIKNAVCCGFLVLLISIIISALYSAINIFKSPEYWTMAFTDALLDTMLIAIPISFITIAVAYLINRRKQRTRK